MVCCWIVERLAPRNAPRAVVLAGLSAWLAIWAGVAAAQTVAPSWEQAGPLWKQFCSSCHQAPAPQGELVLAQHWTAAEVAARRDAWESAVEMLRSGAMPPDDQPRPDAEQRRRMLAAAQSLLHPVDCTGPQDPGRATPRRLNRAEYNNTVRDLLRVDLRPADEFPADDVGDGFDNIGDVLSLPPLLMEKYLEAAEQLAAAAIFAPDDLGPWKIGPQDLQRTGGGLGEEAVCLYTNGDVSVLWHAPCAGDYRITWRAAPAPAGDEPPRLQAAVDGEARKQWDLTGPSGQVGEFAVDVRLAAGPHRLAAAFLNDFYDPQTKADRNLFVHGCEIALIEADLAPAAHSAAHQAMVVRRPEGGEDVPAAARDCLAPFLRRAFRRPLAAEEVARYAKLVEQVVAEGGSFEQGLRVAVTAALVSPRFLFRVVEQGSSSDGSRAAPLNDHELAERLSYFLWSTLPDQRLMQLAEQGRLHEKEVLRAEVERMRLDPRSRALSENFAGQWLNLRLLQDAQPAPDQFAAFDEEIRAAAWTETTLFCDAVLRDDLPITAFLTGRFSFLNQRLAEYYGLAGVEGENFRRVDFTAEPRIGVLTHASVLTLTSNPTRTSPVKRGKWILENLLDARPPEPPPNVPPLEQTAAGQPALSLRRQMELHRRDPVCASCHRTMDALGFGLENFDAIGKWRDRDNGAPIDAAGRLSEQEAFSGPLELAAILDGRRDEFRRALAGKMLTYAIGRGLTRQDACAVDRIVAQLQQGDDRCSELIWAIVTSDPFGKRRGEEAQP